MPRFKVPVAGHVHAVPTPGAACGAWDQRGGLMLRAAGAAARATGACREAREGVPRPSLS